MYEKELLAMIEAAKLAAKKIKEVHSHSFKVEIKSDNSPVTEADKQADKIIYYYLKERFADYGFLTEESIDDKSRLQKEKVFIVDPLDGTQEFCHGYDDFVTLIALSYLGKIVAGVIYVPLKDEYYYATLNQGAYSVKNGKVTRLHVSDHKNHLTMYTSRFHPSSPEKIVPAIDKRISCTMIKGSALKAVCIASGEGEIHYRLCPGTKEWDIAPIDLLVKEAGGVFIQPNGENFTYNKDDVYNHEGFIVANLKENIVDIPNLYRLMKEYDKNNG